MDNQAIKQFYELLRCKICDRPKTLSGMKYSPSTICLPLRNDIFICHMIKSPPFKERKLLHFTYTPLSYNQYSGEIFCSPAKYSFLPESCQWIRRILTTQNTAQRHLVRTYKQITNLIPQHKHVEDTIWNLPTPQQQLSGRT